MSGLFQSFGSSQANETLPLIHHPSTANTQNKRSCQLGFDHVNCEWFFLGLILGLFLPFISTIIVLTCIETEKKKKFSFAYGSFFLISIVGIVLSIVKLQPVAALVSFCFIFPFDFQLRRLHAAGF